MSARRSAVDVSERELLGLTRDLDAMHRDLLPRLRAALRDQGEGWREPADALARASRLPATRRALLRGGLVTAGALGGGVVLGGCGGGSSSSGTGTVSTSASTSASSPDVAVARLAASLEVLAVSTYQRVLDAAGKQQFGAVPPAIATFITTAKAQHADHQSAWNSALVGAGKPAQTAPDPRYLAVVDRTLPTLTDVAGVARLALTLETVALETYAAGAMAVSDPRNREVALSIAPVEAQHVAILQFLLGSSPVPDAFTPADNAASTGDVGG